VEVEFSPRVNRTWHRKHLWAKIVQKARNKAVEQAHPTLIYRRLANDMGCFPIAHHYINPLWNDSIDCCHMWKLTLTSRQLNPKTTRNELTSRETEQV